MESDSTSQFESSDAESLKLNREFKCTYRGCSASFSKNHKLLTHIRKHTGERPFACNAPGCTKTYTNSSHLRRHKKVTHEEKSSQTITCDFEGCGRVLANKYSLKKHYTRKHNPNSVPFKCNECDEIFHKKKLLQQHVYIHTGEPTFSCDLCEWKFSTNYSLNKHKRTHRTYKCDCGETFGRWSMILAHKKQCSPQRYVCEICDKTFNQGPNLKTHKLTHLSHSEKTLYKCTYPNCDRSYTTRYNLKFHVDNFHEQINKEVPFKCTYPKCMSMLKTKRLLKLHLERHEKWVKKKERKRRHDRGKPKKSVLSILIGPSTESKAGKDDSKESQQEVVISQPESELPTLNTIAAKS